MQHPSKSSSRASSRNGSHVQVQEGCLSLASEVHLEPRGEAAGPKLGAAGQQRTDDAPVSEDLDEVALLKMVDGNQGLAGELAGLFLSEIEPRMNEITSAVTERDAVRLRAGAHALRGSAATMHAENVSAAADALETMGRSGLLDGVQRALEELHVAMAILRPRLVAMVGAP
jgi:HPt (histidine-containing phosphotransfer) domain-containing protein